MADYEALYRAVAYLIYRHGRIDRIDSHTEHWLGLEARLRQDFGILGQKPADLDFNRRKSGMKEIFRQAGVPVAPGEKVTSAEQIRAFVARHGFPVVLQAGRGRGRPERLPRGQRGAARRGPRLSAEGFLHRDVLPGTLVSFDGLTDREGGIVFCASHRVSSGIMEIVTEHAADPLLLPAHDPARRSRTWAARPCAPSAYASASSIRSSWWAGRRAAWAWRSTSGRRAATPWT